jgi:hypothetical protein
MQRAMFSSIHWTNIDIERRHVARTTIIHQELPLLGNATCLRADVVGLLRAG